MSTSPGEPAADSLAARVALAPWRLLQASPLRPALDGAGKLAEDALLRTYSYVFFDAPGPVRRLQSRLSYDVMSLGLSAALPRGLADPGLDAVTAGSGFLNYGYEDDEHEAFVATLGEQVQARSHSVRLYEQALRGADTAGKDLLEVGCGRGGGSSYMVGHLAPASVTGIDISPAAISFAKYAHEDERLSYLVGDAEAIPFADETFDIVVNVESSHCYGSMSKFLSEARRVLRPGGMLAWVDPRPRGKLADTQRSFARSGLDVVRATDITANVLRSLEATSDEKIALVDDQVPLLLRPLVKSGMAVRGTVVYEALANGDLVYLSKLLRKPAAAGYENSPA
jgi:SAM-dependent methyltransferase